MTFNTQTKFSIGDTIYFLKDNKVNKDKIRSVSVTHYRNTEHITYTGENIVYIIAEDEAFATQEELLDSIMLKEE